MPFEIVRNDIVNMRVDAIVNTANPKPVIGWGVDADIHRKAGPELLAARQKIGNIPVGGAAITPGARFCASCGAAQEPPKPAGPAFCPGCGAALTEGVRFCGECGYKVS